MFPKMKKPVFQDKAKNREKRLYKRALTGLNLHHELALL